MTIPKITPYSGGVANPDGSQTQTEFTQNMFDQLSYEAELSTELNNTVDGINDTATQVDADATSAAQSASAAEAAVSGLNYQGLWPDTGGSADKGDTYQTQVSGTGTGQYFTALQGTTVDPVGDDVNWREVVSKQSLGGITNYQAASVADMIAGKTISGNTVAPEVITHKEGQFWSTNGTTWRHLGTSTGTIQDFKTVEAVAIEDYIQSDETAGFTEALSNHRGLSVSTQDGAKYSITQPLKLRKLQTITGSNKGVLISAEYSYISKTTNNTVEITNPERPTKTVDCLIYTDGQWEDGVFTSGGKLEGLTLSSKAPSSSGTAIYVIQGGINLENVGIEGFDVAIDGDEMWSCYLEKVSTDGLCKFSNGTSINIQQSALTGGLLFDNIRYSSLTAVSSDYAPRSSYTFNNCVGINLESLGSEHCRSESDDLGDAIAFTGGNVITVSNGYFVTDTHPTRAVHSFINDKVRFIKGKSVFVTGTTPSFDNYDAVITGNGAFIEFDGYQFGNLSYDNPKIRFNAGVTTSVVLVRGNSTDIRPKIYYSDGSGTTLVRYGIVDAGANENGNYVKFDDGTMICNFTIPKAEFSLTSEASSPVQSIVFYRSGVFRWLYPSSFASRPNLSIQPITNGSSATRFCWARTALSGSNQNISGDIQLGALESFYSGANNAYDNLEEVQIQAVGRWK